MVVVKVNSSNEVNFVLQVTFMHLVITKLPTEVVGEFFLYRLVCDFRCPSQGAVTSWIRSPCKFKALRPSTSSALRSFRRKLYIWVFSKLWSFLLFWQFAKTAADGTSSLVLVFCTAADRVTITFISQILCGPSIWYLGVLIFFGAKCNSLALFS